MRRFSALLWTAIFLPASTSSTGPQEWSPPEFRRPEKGAHPCVACTKEELARLREAFKGAGTEHEVVAKIVADAEKAIRKEPTFPPRGGQHNQWYQCEKCQRALTTVDDTHHKCPGCGKVYSGEPYDDVIFSKIHGRNLENARKAAWAYAITGDKTFADFAAKVLLGYASRYLNYPYHDNSTPAGKKKAGPSGGHLFEQTLDEASHFAIAIAPAYDLVFEALSEADRKTIRGNLLEPMLENIEKHKAGKSNWQTWHNAALLWGGACLEDPSWAKKAVEQPGNGFAFQMKECVTGDGMWYENSWDYHFYTLQAMVLIAEGARRMGADLWSHPSLKKMFTLPVAYTMADGSLPRFGDAVNASAKSGRPQMEAAYAAMKDASILSVLPSEPSWDSILLGREVAKKGEAPKLGSRLFKSAGHAILRVEEGGLTAALTFAPFGGFHGHFDKLSFVFFAFGNEVGVDPGRAASQAYRLPIHKNWYRATISHNAVLVDRKCQGEAGGKPLLYAASDHFAAVRAECTEAYKEVTHRRFLLLTPQYLLVFDELTATDGTDHRFDWIYHDRGHLVRSDAAEKSGSLENFPGAEYVQNVNIGSTNEGFTVWFADVSAARRVIVDAQEKTQVAIGDGPGAAVTDRVPLMIVSRSGPSARFAAVIEPGGDKARPLASVECSEKDGGATIRVKRGNDTDAVVLSADGKLEVRRGADVVLKSD